MSVHYKFKSALDYDTITFDGLHISVADLKAAILHQKRLNKTCDFDLQVTNAQTKEVYVDEHTLIPKNTSLVIARVPLAQQPKKSWDGGAGAGSAAAAAARKEAALSKGLADLSRMDGSEEDKINAMMSQSTLDYDPSNYQKVRGQNRPGEVPPSYRCHKCHQGGHWISNCPNANSESGDVRRSTGIPRSFMVPVAGPRAPGAMMTPAGDFAVPVVDHEAYQASEAGTGGGAGPGFAGEAESVRRDIPDDLLCSLCRDLLTDAVMIPCCGNSFCDECIRGALLESEDHECPDCREKDISPTTLIPNRFLRNSVSSFRNQTGYSRRARPPPVKIPTAPEIPTQESNIQPQNGPTNSQGGVVGAQQSHEDSDGSYDDNITVTVPPPQAAQLRSHPGPRPRPLHAHAHTRPYGSPHGIRPMKPSGMDQPPPNIGMPQREERASTPTVDERRDPGMPNMQAMPPMQGMPNMPPMQQPNMAYRPPGQVPVPYGMRPAAPMQQFMPYGVATGQQVPAGPPPRSLAPGQPGGPTAAHLGGHPPLGHPGGPPVGHTGGPHVTHAGGPPVRHSSGPPPGHLGGPPPIGQQSGPPLRHPGAAGSMGPRPRAPFPGGPRGAFPRPSYQPSPPGIKDAAAPASGVDEQLEAFERMIREKAERARRRDEDRRRTDRSRSLSRTPRSRTPHSRDSSPRPIKRLSRSRSRPFSRSRSPRPIRSPRALRSPPRVRSPLRPGRSPPGRSPRSLGRRSPPPQRRRSPWSPRRRRTRSRTRERSLSLSRSRSLSPRRRRSPAPQARFRSPPLLRSPPSRSPGPHGHPPRTPPHHRPTEPRRYPPSFEDSRVSPMRSMGQRPPPDPHYNPRYQPRNAGPLPNYMAPVMNLKPIPMASDAPPMEDIPPYRSRFPEVPFEDGPPGTQPPVPGFEDSPPFEKKDKLLPPGISERERPSNFREPVYQRGNYIDGPPSGYKNAAPLNEIPPAFRDSSGYRDEFRDNPSLPYREGLPIPPYVEPLYREPNIPPVYRDGIPPTQVYREGVTPPYRNGPPQFRDGPTNFRNNPQGGFRDAPSRSYRDGPPHNFRDSTFRPDHPNFRETNIPDIRDMPQNYQDPNFRDNNFREDGPPTHLRNRPAGREGHGYNRHNNYQNMRGNNRNPNMQPHDRTRDGPRQDREYRDRINARDAARELERTERNREVDKNERFDRGDDRKDRDKHRDRDGTERERDREKDKDRDRDNVYEKVSPERRRRASNSPMHRIRSKDDKLKRDRPSELRGHSREADPRKGDKSRKDDKVDDKHKEAKDKKIRERKKKKKEKDGDKKEKKRKERKDKKEKEHRISDEENKEPREENENKEFEENNDIKDEGKKELLPPAIQEEPDKTVSTVDDLYKDVATEGIDETVIASYGQIKEEQDIQLQKQNGTQDDSHAEEKDGSFDGIELQATAEELELKGECENIRSKNEVLAPVPELSKWEVDDDLDKTREPGEIVSPLADKSGKVTSEVLKRAENAIFAKAINAIRPIEIKRLSSDRAKLYSEEDSQTESGDKELQALNNIQITVPVTDSEFRSVEINEMRKSRYEKTPPPKLSVKDRLGGKVDDPMKRRDDRMLHSTVERIKSRSKTPKQSDMTYRRITVESREKGRRYVSKPEESMVHRMGLANDRVRRDERRGQDRSNRYDVERRVERPDPREARHGRREHEGVPSYARDREMIREDPNNGRPERKISLSESRERHRKKEKKLRKEKEERKSKLIEKADKMINKDLKDGTLEIETKSVVEHKKTVLERDRKKSTLDEANFEPDYDETLESETENKDEHSKKRERSRTPPGQGDLNSVKKAKVQGGADETVNVKNAVTTDSESSSGSESTSSSSSSDSDQKKRKKKRKKAKRKKSKRHVSESDSDSDGSSSDEPKKKKKKKKHKKKADKKKKKKSKHK